MDKNNIKYKILIIHISKHKQKQMKKQYTQPELYVETIEVEQGIAMSVVSESFIISGYEDGEDYSGMWE